MLLKQASVWQRSLWLLPEMFKHASIIIGGINWFHSSKQTDFARST